jgi:hypothetical protein
MNTQWIYYIGYNDQPWTLQPYTNKIDYTDKFNEGGGGGATGGR